MTQLTAAFRNFAKESRIVPIIYKFNDIKWFWVWKIRVYEMSHLFHSRLNFVHPCRWLSVCNVDTTTGAAWKRGSIPIEFLFQCVHLVASRCCCCCCCCCFVLSFITVLCLFGDIPRLVSLLRDVCLLTSQLYFGSKDRVTLHFYPPTAVLKALRIPVSFIFLVLLSFLSLCFHSSIYLSVISFSFSIYFLNISLFLFHSISLIRSFCLYLIYVSFFLSFTHSLYIFSTFILIYVSLSLLFYFLALFSLLYSFIYVFPVALLKYQHSPDIRL